MKKLIAGNWKMNGSVQFSKGLTDGICHGLKSDPELLDVCDFLVFPPFSYIYQVHSQADGQVSVGAQDCSLHLSGAYTGEVSALMVKDCGARFVLLGHSERRQYHHETDDIVAAKAKAAHEQGLVSVICVGETENQRTMGQEKVIVAQQLSKSVPEGANAQNIVIAYEPVWAIGTGKNASVDDILEMHAFIRSELISRDSALSSVRILYGGSMKPENSAEILAIPNVDGGLIGGASLKAESFLDIARSVLKE